MVLGGNVFGWTADESASFAVLDAFVEAGGTAIDTADAYSAWIDGNVGGESERIIGAWLRARPGMRERVSIATKVSGKPDRRGLAPANVRAALAESLDRLQTDYVDVLYAHRDDPEVPQEDVVMVFGELVAEGLVNRIGASNFTAERLHSAVDVAKAHGVEAFTVSQDGYSLVHRDIEAGLVPTLTRLDIIELPYKALQGGFLTGKYRPGVTVDSPRAGAASQLLSTPRNVELLDALRDVAEGRGVSMAAVALSWLRQQPRVAAPIASARTVEQLASLVESFDLVLTEEELARLA